jgi:hypothetical protein
MTPQFEAFVLSSLRADFGRSVVKHPPWAGSWGVLAACPRHGTVLVSRAGLLLAPNGRRLGAAVGSSRLSLSAEGVARHGGAAVPG